MFRYCRKDLRIPIGRHISTIITPGQGIVSHDSITFFKSYINDPKIKNLISLTDEITKQPISSIFSPSPVLDFQKTSIQQPLIILLNSIQRQILKNSYDVDLYDTTGKIDYCIGHSIGEITNLALQNCISFTDAIRISHKRGLLMEEIIGNGSTYKMFALIIAQPDFEKFQSALLLHNDKISISNINSDEQIVISGRDLDCNEVISDLSKKFKIRKKVDLQVSIPFHNKILTPIIGELYEEFLNTKLTKWLKIGSILNLDGSVNKLTTDYLSKILLVTSQPVNFKKCIDRLIETGEELTFIHYSPVTKNLVSRYLRNRKITGSAHYCLEGGADFEAFAKHMNK